MEEIKVGEWGRTNLGNIIKFAWIEEEPGVRAKNKVVLVDLLSKTVDCFYYFKKNEFIVKHSKNIIDIIEEGDLIKIPGGIFEVIYDKSYEKLGILVPNKTCLSIEHSALEYIFSEYKNAEILTKEQFNQMKYIVGDE